MKVELTAIEITTESGKTQLTIDEAKELYRQLHELFGEKVITIPSAPVVVERWPTWPVYPQIIWTTSTVDPLPQTYPTIICQGKMIEECPARATDNQSPS